MKKKLGISYVSILQSKKPNCLIMSHLTPDLITITLVKTKAHFTNISKGFYLTNLEA